MINYGKQMVIRHNKQKTQAIISCVLIALGVSLWLSAYSFLYYVIQNSLTIKENSPLFHLWRVNPMPLYLKIYPYNWTNPEDIYKPHVKPKFEDIGPFVFAEHKEKKNVTFHSNGTISFQQYHTYIFDRNMSIADLTVPINTINPVLWSAVYYVTTQSFGYLSRKALLMVISLFNQTIPLMKPVGVYLFEGYDDILYTIGTFIPWMKMPPYDKFAWLYQRNGSSWGGHFNMDTSYHNFGVLKSWNYANTTSVHERTCGNFTDVSAGELYPPYRTKNRIELFFADLCRSVPLDFDEEVEVEGIRGYKYSLGTSFLDNGTLIPENKCYCQGECLPYGTVNIASCKFGAPGFVSLPHFYKADDFYTRAIDIKQPQKEKDEFFIVLEPYTGIPLQVVARMQLNLFVQPVKHLSTFARLPRVMFPVLWAEQVASPPLYLITILKLVLYIPTLLQLTGILITAIGLHFSVQSFASYIIKYQRILQTAPNTDGE